MMNEKTLLQKLKNKSKSQNLSFQLVLQLFCQEEFLRRLSYSEYKEKLILKGGLFLFTYTGFESRPTMDIEFLAKALSNEKDDMKGVIEHIIDTPTEYGYIHFEIKSIDYIAEIKEYHGVRVKLVASIANTKTPFYVDIGIGDIVVPDIQKLSVPTQLENFNPPLVSTYSLESTIAEKLEAIFNRMEATSRMKDYYDIYYLSSNYDFDVSVLTEAIKQTFEKRGTSYALANLERVSRMYLDDNMSKRWQVFSKKSLGINLQFEVVLKEIKVFIESPLSILNDNDKNRW